MKQSSSLILLVVVIALAFAYHIVTRSLDRSLQLERIMEIPQATVILDKQGNELFRFFEEDRRWLPYESISPHMINAIIAVEDQHFRSNNGTDKEGLVRAIGNNIAVRWNDEGQLQGGSTITQQLVKNTFLTNKKTIQRKIRELVLARQLTHKRRRLYEREGLSSAESFRKAKEDIISAYLNYIFFGNHSYGIDAAARHYFHTTAGELTIIQSAVLAALPQAPSLYNPTINQESVMGFRSVTTSGSNQNIALNQTGAASLYTLLQQKPLSLSHDCLGSVVDRATLDDQDVQRTYQQGRKDRVLCRLYETGYLQADDLKEAFLQGRDLVFHKARFSIRAPHFVYRVQQYLLTLPFFRTNEIDVQTLSQAGYTVTTTLDGELQEAAEVSLLNYRSALTQLGANNRAMIHVNSTNGDVLSYVGSLDFFDETIHGQVDVLHAIRQVGSTLKPFFYAYLFAHYPFTPQGIIVDFPLPKNSPGNHDNMFRGKLTMARALGSSRNLPAVRLFFAVGGAPVLVPYLRELGFTYLDTEKEYSYPLALGADAMTLFQLTQGYTQLSATGKTYTTINPIASITDSYGDLLYTKQHEERTKVIPDTVADMIRSILSDKNTMPQNRRRLRTLPLKNLALKTGTSDIKVGEKTLPRDGLSVIYTPTDVVVSRAGNTDGSAMGPKAYGGEINHYSLRQYLEAVVEQQKTIDQPRITETHYRLDGSYAGTDHPELTAEQKYLLRRGVR